MNNSKSIILHIHIDDGLIVGKSRCKILKLLADLQLTYKIKSAEKPVQHLGYTFDWKENGAVLFHQRDYCKKVLDDFSMSNANPIKIPAPINLVKKAAEEAELFKFKLMEKAIGMLNHLALHSQPDILHTVNVLLQYTTKPTVKHWSLVKHLLRYLQGTTSVGILYQKSTSSNDYLNGWADAD